MFCFFHNIFSIFSSKCNNINTYETINKIILGDRRTVNRRPIICRQFSRQWTTGTYVESEGNWGYAIKDPGRTCQNKTDPT